MYFKGKAPKNLYKGLGKYASITIYYVKKYEYKDGTKTVFVNGPVHFRSVDPEKFEYKISGPIGRDTAELLAELGYTEDQIKAMYEAQEVK